MILLIDADDTLFDFKRSERESIIATAKKFGAADPEGAADIFTLINKACWLDVEKGVRTREQIAVDRFRELKSRLSLDADAETINEYYKAQMRGSHHLLPGAGKFLRLFAGAGCGWFGSPKRGAYFVPLQGEGLFPKRGLCFAPSARARGVSPCQGARCARHFFFSLLEKKKCAAPGGKKKRGFGAEMVGPCFSFGLQLGRSLYQFGARASP